MIKRLLKVFQGATLVLKFVARRLIHYALINIKVARALNLISSWYVLRKKNMRGCHPSLVYSNEDVNPSSYLVEIVVDAIKIASKTKLNCGKTNLDDSKFLNIFPGEHYRLLDAIVRKTQASSIVEIGTFTGMGTLALRDGMEADVKVTTYDIIEWNKLDKPSHFNSSDFYDGGIIQIIGDLSNDDFFSQNLEHLNGAEIIFMDAPKDDIFEYKMSKHFSKLDKKKEKLLIIDDIQFINMIDFWRSIKSPKLDVSSFGHWSGTGIVDISGGFELHD